MQVERRRRGRGAPSNEAEGMGAMTRRRRGRGGDDDEEGNDTAERNKASENEDKADGRQGRGKMDAETRRRAMRGGKIVEDDKVWPIRFVEFTHYYVSFSGLPLQSLSSSLLRSIHTARVTMRRGTLRCGASRHMLFFQFTLVKPCLIFLVTMASQQQDMLLALALQTQVIALIVLQKQRKSDDFRF